MIVVKRLNAMGAKKCTPKEYNMKKDTRILQITVDRVQTSYKQSQLTTNKAYKKFKYHYFN